MDQRSDRPFASARWLVGSSFALVFGLAVDSAAGAEEPDATDAAPTAESSTASGSAKAASPQSRDEGRESRGNGKAKGKKSKDQPSELLALSSAVESEPEVVCKNVAVTG